MNVDVKLKCTNCEYEEIRSREEDESLDPIKCPNCDGFMYEVDGAEEE